MLNKYRVSVHTARMETRYGIDVATLIDDPDRPAYDDPEKELMQLLGYVDDEMGGYPGHWVDDESVGAYFDYDGCTKYVLPSSLVERIIREN